MLRECKPVTVPRAAFIFCKYTVALILWAALIFQVKWLVLAGFVLLALSAILKIGRAPLIVLYSCTINKIIKSRNKILDEHGMRFAHTLGAVLTLICIILLYFVNDTAGWIMLSITAVTKTAGALGFCSALKLYGCMSSDSCCTFIKKDMREKHD